MAPTEVTGLKHGHLAPPKACLRDGLAKILGIAAETFIDSGSSKISDSCLLLRAPPALHRTMQLAVPSLLSRALMYAMEATANRTGADTVLTRC